MAGMKRGLRWCSVLLVLLALLAGGCRSSTPVREPLLQFGGSGAHDGQFHMPREVGFSPDGKRLYILDRSHRVQVFNPDGTFVAMWPTPFGPRPPRSSSRS